MRHQSAVGQWLQRHHLDRTTPAVGGALLTSPPKVTPGTSAGSSPVEHHPLPRASRDVTPPRNTTQVCSCGADQDPHHGYRVSDLTPTEPQALRNPYQSPDMRAEPATSHSTRRKVPPPTAFTIPVEQRSPPRRSSPPRKFMQWQDSGRTAHTGEADVTGASMEPQFSSRTRLTDLSDMDDIVEDQLSTPRSPSTQAPSSYMYDVNPPAYNAYTIPAGRVGRWRQDNGRVVRNEPPQLQVTCPLCCVACWDMDWCSHAQLSSCMTCGSPKPYIPTMATAVS